MRKTNLAMLTMALAAASPAAPKQADKPIKWDGNKAEARTYDIGGIHGQCAGLIDVRYAMVNGDIPASFHADDDIILDETLYNALSEKFAEDVAREDITQVTAGTLPQSFFNASDSRIQDRLNSYGRQRRDSLYQAILARGDTTSEAYGTFTTVNDAVARFYIPQRDKYTCYAASLETAFRYLQMKGQYADFVNHRNGICPAMSSGPKTATYGEILAAIRSAVLDKQTAAFDWTLPSDTSALVRHKVFRQDFANGIIHDQGASDYWIGSRDVVGGLIGHALLPSVFRGQKLLSQTAQPPPIQTQSQGMLDSNGNPINLYEIWTWQRTNNAKLGGHVWPLKSTGDLVAAMMSREVVMVGFGGKSAGHTVLVTGIRYKPRVEYLEHSIIYTDRSMIMDIRVLDPLDVNHREYWFGDMNKFFQEYRFGIAIADRISI
jgi:hypothetical protein